VNDLARENGAPDNNNIEDITIELRDLSAGLSRLDISDTEEFPSLILPL